MPLTQEEPAPAACSRQGIGSQFGHPRGVVGFLVGYVMAVKNAGMNLAVADRLELEATDRVLEVGFGPGVLVKRLSSRLREGLVAGVDPSVEMLRQARRRNAASIREGRVDLRLGSVPGLPFPDGSFTKAVCVNLVHHLDDLDGALADLRRVLVSGGLLVVAIRLALPGPPRPYRSPGLSPAEVDRIVLHLERASFATSVTRRTAGRDLALVEGRRGPAR